MIKYLVICVSAMVILSLFISGVIVKIQNIFLELCNVGFVYLVLFQSHQVRGVEERQRLMVSAVAGAGGAGGGGGAGGSGGGGNIMMQPPPPRPYQENQAKFHAAFVDGDFEFVSSVY